LAAHPVSQSDVDQLQHHKGTFPTQCRDPSRDPSDNYPQVVRPDEHVTATEPYFAIYNNNFTSILGANPSLTIEIEKDWQFAHEAGIYVPSEEAVYITSNKLISKDAEAIIVGVVRFKYDHYEYEEIHPNVTMANGGINYHNELLFCDQGNKTHASGLKLVQAKPPYETRTLLSSFRGRPFNSPNDVAVHKDGSIWFTDPIYGSEQGFRGPPQLPNQVYRFDPSTGDVRVVADGFGRPNGITFSPDQHTVYITDTDYIHGNGTVEPTRAATM
jgi:gluconolactonase